MLKKDSIMPLSGLLSLRDIDDWIPFLSKKCLNRETPYEVFCGKWCYLIWLFKPIKWEISESWSIFLRTPIKRRRSWFQRWHQFPNLRLVKGAFYRTGRDCPKRYWGEDAEQRVYERLVRGRDQAECWGIHPNYELWFDFCCSFCDESRTGRPCPNVSLELLVSP